MFYLFFLNRAKARDIICAKITALVLMGSVLFSGMPALVFAEDGGEDVPPQTAEEPQVTEESDVPSVEGEDASAEEVLVIIETGDAVSEVDIINVVNTNDTEVLTSTDDGGFSDTSASTTDEILGMYDELDTQTSSTTSATTSAAVTGSSTDDVLGEDVSIENGGDEGSDITVTNNNDAVVENTATSTAQTGENEASGNNGDALIITGDAIASANIVNTVNTNILNSEGFLLFLNSFSGELDLRDLAYWDLLEQDGGDVFDNDCDLGSCGTGSLFSSNDNTAEIVNNITVGVSTGGNTASGNDNSAILTGNAYASANVVNIANTNIIDSNYLLITANNFGSLSGDIIFPSAAEFSRLFFGNGSISTAPIIAVTNDNTATVVNDVNVTANSGENNASGNGGGSFIMTGDAYAGSNVVNQINQNFINAGSFFLLLRVYGNWSGSVYAPPEGLMWTETSGGVAIYNDPIFGAGGSGSGAGALTVQNSNTATITNNVNVYALTGENHADGNEGNAGILSGNAYAGANVVNVANTNVIGQNWALAIINIFGDWDGNISFGQPDLWIGGQVDTGGKAQVEVGNEVVYHYTIINNSDTIATNVRVVENPSEHIMFKSSQSGGRLESGKVVWEIGDLVSGASAEVEYTAYVKGSLPVANTLLENIVTVVSGGTDANREDNTDTVAVKGYRQPPYLSSWSDNSGFAKFTPDPILSITKTNNATTTLFASTTVDYTITVKNDGGEAYDAYLFDTLKDEQDNIVYEQYWALDTIYPNEEITIEYSIVYDENTVPGTYINYAQIEAIAGNPSLDPILGTIIFSSVATSSINIATGTPPVSDFETELIEPLQTDTGVGGDEGEIQDDLSALKLNGKKIPAVNKRNTIAYRLYDLIQGDMFTPVPVNFVKEKRNKDEQVIVTVVNILNKLGGFVFVGSSGAQFSSFKSLADSKKGVSNSKNAPYDQLASIFDSFVKMWAIPYSWTFILVLLGFALTLLMRTRTNIVR